MVLLRMTCFLRQFAPEGLRECDGPVDRHHVVSQQAIKRTYPRLPSYATDREVQVRKAAMNSALRDDRNLVMACRRHHELFHNARFEVPEDGWPVSVRQFAA